MQITRKQRKPDSSEGKCECFRHEAPSYLVPSFLLSSYSNTQRYIFHITSLLHTASKPAATAPSIPLIFHLQHNGLSYSRQSLQ
jgi:hypothetical protein